MHQILIVDDMAIFREPIAQCLRLAGYEVASASSGGEALKAIAARVPDVVILDVSMPDMDGIAVLREMRARPVTAKTPVILLTASSDKSQVLASVKLGVRDYVLKTQFSLGNLLERVRKHLDEAISKESGPQKLLTREQCIKRIEIALGGKSLSAAVTRINTMAASPDGDASALAGIISREPGLTEKVLAIANRPAFARAGGPYTKLADAIRTVGCVEARDIAASVSIFEAFPAGCTDAFNPGRAFQHAYAVGTLAATLSGGGHNIISGMAFLCGLCHDLGETIIQTHFAAEFEQIAQAAAKSGSTVEALERQMLGLSRVELGGEVLERIGVPEKVRVAIALMQGGQPLVKGNAHSLAGILRMADAYANGIFLSFMPGGTIAPFGRRECKELCGNENPVIPEGSEIQAQAAAIAAALGLPDAENGTPTFDGPRRRIWLARQSILSNCDPISAALELVAEVSVRPTLPMPMELQDYHGLVICSPSPTAAGFRVDDLNHLGDCGVPMLWLTGTEAGDGVKTRNGQTPMRWPLRIERLAAFVHECAANATRKVTSKSAA